MTDYHINQLRRVLLPYLLAGVVWLVLASLQAVNLVWMLLIWLVISAVWIGWWLFEQAREEGWRVFQQAREEESRRQECQRLAQAELQCQTRLAQMEKTIQELEAFNFTVAHDLRVPVSHVQVFASILLDEEYDKLGEDSRQLLTQLQQSSKRLEQLIDALLAFAQLGQKALTLQSLDMAALIQDIRAEFQFQLRNRPVEWHVGALPVIMGDPVLLRQVWTNLIGNSIKYSQPRPVIRIEIGEDRRTQNEVILFIRDNGVGFDMQQVGQLFQVFKRLHKADDFAGTGIGLASTARIIGRHGGRIWAEAEVDKGACFFMSLPLGGATAIPDALPK